MTTDKTDYNMPSNNLHADIYLNGRKLLLMEVAARILNGSISDIHDANDFVWSEIKEIDKLLEG